ncbi:adenosine receptor A3-like [Oculina patagonica]
MIKTSDSLISLGNQTTHIPASNCAISFPGEFPPKNVVLFMAIFVVNILSSFTAATANFLVMWAIKKTPSLHTPSSVLLFWLALSDFATGGFVQPLFSVNRIAALTTNSPVYCISGAIVYPVCVFLVLVSLSTITAISFDRYLALALHLRYATIVTASRLIKSILITFLLFFPLSIYFWFSREHWLRMTLLSMGLILVVVCIITIPFSYCRIFAILRRHQKQIRNQNDIALRMHGVSQVDISKYRKYVLTTLLVLGSILLSYLPCGICLVSALFSKMEESELVRHIGRIGGMMVLLNSSINPLVYCWRIKEIRRFVVSKLRQLVGVNSLPDGAVRVTQVRPVSIPSYRETPI